MTQYILTIQEERRRAEATLLGSLLLHPDEGRAMMDLLQPEEFYEESHRLIYEALLTLMNTSEQVSIHAVNLLLTQDELKRVGGVPHLSMLQQEAKSSAIPIVGQVQRLKLATATSLLDQVKETLQTQAEGSSNGLDQLVHDLERVRRITQHLLTQNSAFPPLLDPFQAELDAYLSELDTRRRQPDILTGISTGFADLDTMTGGLQRSDLVIVAGPPSIGKTSFALSIALHVLLEGHYSVGLFSLESPTRQVITRLLSMEAKLDQRLLRSLEMKDDEWGRLGEASAALSGASLWIDDSANLSTVLLKEKAHLLVERSGVQLLIIDYVHLMHSRVNDKRHENRVQEIGEVSRSLKTLAREFDIPVLALAQVSRAFESRPSKKLQLFDLRDGSLENDADLILFLSVAEADPSETTGAPRLATISIAKHRNGPLADLDVCFLPSSTRFCDWPALSKPSIPHQPTTAAPAQANPSAERFPRLQEIMARAMQRSVGLGNAQPPPIVKQGRQGRALPIGVVLEDEEGDGELS